MASVNFSGGKLHGSGETLAQFRHSEREERLKHGHTNEDINKTMTRDNWSVAGLGYDEMRARYTARVAEVDKTASNHRKDRVTCVCAVVPVPEGMTDLQARAWYKDVWAVFSRRYGTDNMIDACVHVDEKHDYIDPDTKENRTSRTHAHFYFVPERDGNFDAKRIVSRAEMKSLNRELDALSRDRYGLRFMDGTQAKSRGTVERMKQRSATAELEVRAERAMDAAKQAERDADLARLSEVAVNRQVAKELAEARREYAAIKAQSRDAAEALQKAQERLLKAKDDLKDTEGAKRALEAEIKAAEDDVRKYSMELPDDYEVARCRAMDALLSWIPEQDAERFRQGLAWVFARKKELGRWPVRRPDAARRWPGQEEQDLSRGIRRP